MDRRDFFKTVAAFMAAAAAARTSAAAEARPAIARLRSEGESLLEAVRSHHFQPFGIVQGIKDRKRVSVFYSAGEPSRPLAEWELDRLIAHHRLVAAGMAYPEWIAVFNRGAACQIDYRVTI